MDGRTLFQRRTGKSFRRVVTPFGQDVTWTATGKNASWIGAGRRWREGVLLGLLFAGQGANNHAFGTSDGVEAGRATELEPEESASLGCGGAAMGPQAA